MTDIDRVPFRRRSTAIYVAPRSRHGLGGSPPDEVVLEVRRPGMVPRRAVVDAGTMTPELLRRLDEQIQHPVPPDPPRSGQGAVDILLRSVNGAHVKSGALVLEGPRGPVSADLDPVSRRFRASGMAPGAYVVRAASAGSGNGTTSILVRDGDVTRTVVRLDGSPPQGTVTLRLAISGATSDAVRVRVTDRISGELVVDQRAVVREGLVLVDAVRAGRLHVSVEDDAGAWSCYDTDASDGGLLGHLGDRFVQIDLTPHRIDPGDPPDEGPFTGLVGRFAHVTDVLPRLGIDSLEALAAAEGEGLMHRAASADLGEVRIERPAFGAAIEAARARLGLTTTSGTHLDDLALRQEGTFTRAFLPRMPGTAVFELQADPSQEVELEIVTPTTVERRVVAGGGTVSIMLSIADIDPDRPLRVRLTNRSGSPLKGQLVARLPADAVLGGRVHAFPTTRDLIETVYRAVAELNPGIDTTIDEALLAPENIRSWLDLARTYLATAGVCSIDDLGRFRVDPMAILRPGIYVAPAKPPVSVTAVAALDHYRFAGLLASTVLHYLPNDTLHDTAVVVGGEWDITGQTIVIGSEIRELVVIAKSIKHDAASRITWEWPTLPGPRSYWPNPAPSGPNGSSAGQRGQDGAPGDPDPHPVHNGGADALTSAPIVTMYVLDSTKGLPPIDLPGQNGGPGGVGQDGGRGGDGQQGEHADSAFFSCCRSVGWGGDGGKGGDAGRGGPGGRGGMGGRMTLLTSNASIAALADAPPSIAIHQGTGGDGGPPGSPGAGGHAGPAGSADCELFCASHDDRHGTDGAAGSSAAGTGRQGDDGPLPLSDAFQLLPITKAQWDEVFNSPHILHLSATDVEPGETIAVTGQNFLPATDRVYFDGALQPTSSASVTSTTSASLTIPLTAEGGTHPVVIRPTGATSRRSNRAMVRVIPKIDAIPHGTRWTEGQSVTVSGLAFSPGCQLVAEDWSVSPHVSYGLPVTSSTRTAIKLTIPPAPLGALRGVRRLVVRNADGGVSRGERVTHIGDTIVVKCAAFRVVGSTPGTGCKRSAADIANLFIEGSAGALTAPWSAARVAFKLVKPVETLVIDDTSANLWAKDPDNAVQRPIDRAFNDAHGVNGILNIFFLADVELSTAYAWIGGGPIFYGDDPGWDITAVDFMQIVAHEIGHALCLPHVCEKDGETADTRFERTCQGGDEQFLMYPFWNISDSMLFAPTQPGKDAEVDIARVGATHFEVGKVAPAAVLAGFGCGAVDAAD